MRGDLVAIDLETTGLDPFHDAIIEVGAVQMRDGEIIGEFSSLIDPGRPISQFITGITGIRNEDIIGAPSIKQVLPELKAFVGNAPLIGHNIGFDTSFLYRQGVFQTNPRIDTYDLASILLPRAARYSLSSLTTETQIELEHAHRALHDARATALLYWNLWQKLLQLPYATLLEINLSAQDIAWDSRIVFDAALQLRSNSGHVVEESLDILELFGKNAGEQRTLRPAEENEPVDVHEIRRSLTPEGALAHSLPGFEYRTQQVEMAEAIANAFNTSAHMLVEAGTGTGKSIAYLVPSVLWALQNNRRVVISTNTINLQEQLIDKDVPTVRAALDIPFRASILKGRANYLCPRRLIAIRRRRPTSVDELRTLAKILVWLLESNTGDRGELNLRGPVENATWQRLSAEDEGCTLERCRSAMEGVCPFYKARRAAESSHLIIVNHALLVTDAMSEHRVLPDYDYLVVDEAHHLEDATTNGLSFRIDEPTLRRRLADLGGPRRGILGNLLNSVRVSASEKDAARMERFVQIVSDTINVMELHISGLFNAFRVVAEDATNGRLTDYSTQVRITDSLRQRLVFAQTQTAWRTLREFFEGISSAMSQLNVALERLRGSEIPDLDDLISSAGTASRYLDEVRAQLDSFTLEPDDNTIYWLNITQESEFLSVHTAPLHVGPLIDEYLWQEKETIILTSATLQTNGSFDYVRERLHADNVETLEVGSPFNYKESTLLFIPTDMPEPNERNRYQQAVERGLVELAAALNGRVLGLFTSYAQLRQTAQAITPRLALGNIAVYDQSDGSSRQALLEGFKASERAVLLGTRSFWEGVDIPGEALSALVIVRLPFAVPSDPIFAARSETYANSFNDYALPDAILRFRQGFGRLIRTRSDRGIVAVFDSRLSTKSYGASFIEALPECTIHRGSMQTLAETAVKWLA